VVDYHPVLTTCLRYPAESLLHALGGLAPRPFVGTKVVVRTFNHKSVKATNTKNIVTRKDRSYGTFKSLLRSLCRLAKIILALYSNVSSVDLSQVVDEYRDFLFSLSDSRGIPFMVSYNKLCRNAIMRYISGEPLNDVPGVKLIEGWPEGLLFLKPLSTDSEGCKALLTLLTLTRAILLKPVLDLSTIIEPWTGEDNISSSEFQRAMISLKVRSGQVDE